MSQHFEIPPFHQDFVFDVTWEKLLHDGNSQCRPCLWSNSLASQACPPLTSWLLEVHWYALELWRFREFFISKSYIKLLDEGQHLISCTKSAIIDEKSNTFRIFLEFLWLMRPLPSQVALTSTFLLWLPWVGFLILSFPQRGWGRRWGWWWRRWTVPSFLPSSCWKVHPSPLPRWTRRWLCTLTSKSNFFSIKSHRRETPMLLVG